MKKKIVSILLALILMISSMPVTVSAQEEEDDPRASSYLNMYSASLTSLGVTGELNLAYQVFATDDMVDVGVFCLIVRNSNGTIHQTIWGSTANGLLAANTWYHVGDYTLNLTSGNTYYCSVYFIAEDANGSDVRKITTQLAVCP
ncbi:MAG: hypothetical protein IIY78_08690 [Clostridia bacterium]|nr:hypothetical protein [Clostridia bacterium]